MEAVCYINAFLDFQKHGARDYNDLLRVQTQTEIDQAQWKLNQTMKQMKAEQDWFYYLAFIRASEFALYKQVDHADYRTSDQTIAVYEVDEDLFVITLEDAIKNCTIWDDNGEIK